MPTSIFVAVAYLGILAATGGSIWVAGRRRPRRVSGRGDLRSLVGLLGLAGTALSWIGFVAMNVNVFLVNRGILEQVDAVGRYRAAAVAGMIGLICSLFAPGTSRFLLLGSGVLLLVLWFAYAAMSR